MFIYSLIFSKEYHNISVQKYEEIYFFLEGITDEDKCEMKLGDSNTYYKYTMKSGWIKYRCKKLHSYLAYKGIHTNSWIKDREKDPCYFYIFDEGELKKMK